MTQEERMQLVLTLDVGAEPIHGTISVAERPPQEFHGWLELAGVLEEARARRSRLGTAQSQAGHA